MLTFATPILVSLSAEQTVAFYTEKLGFTFHSEWDGYVIFNRDGVNIHLAPCDNPEIAKNTGCYVNVTQIDTLYAEYQQLGITYPNGDLAEMPWGMKQFSIVDNNGCLIHFGEPMPGNED